MPSNETGPSGSRIGILVVEDEAPFRGLTERFLDQSGYRVFTAEDGVKGLEVYQAHQADIHLVLLDLILPQMSGLECLKQLKQVNPNIKVLVMSGYSQTVSKKILLAEGMADFLKKPFPLEQLLQMIQTTLK